MRRPAAPGSARERDGRTRRAGAGRADAGQDTTKDRHGEKGPAGEPQAKGEQPRVRGEETGRLPAQPGRGDRESRRTTAADKTATTKKTTSTRTTAAAERADGKRAGTARTDGRGRRLGAGGVGAIPGSSGGTRTPRAPERRSGDPDRRTADKDTPAADSPATDDVEDAGTKSTTAGTKSTTAGEETTDGATDGTGGDPAEGRPENKARPRPVRPAPHILRRRRIALLVVVLVLLGGLAGGVALLLYGSGLADVETVTVDGALAVPQDQVLAAAAIPTGGPLAGVDTSGAEQRVAALPGVASVTVGRDWPHTVVVTVVERVAVALADTPKGLMLVDRTGVPYEQAPEVPPALPHLNVSITGTITPGDVQTTAGLGVLAALPDAVRSQVLTITVIAPAATGGLPTVELALSDDRRVVWGSAENSQRKAAVLTALLTERGSVFDVASPDLPTIRR